MNIYHYSKENGQYLMTSEARVDPLETEKAQRAAYLTAYNDAIDAGEDEPDATDLAQTAASAVENIYLIPAYATENAPPEAGENEVAVFDGEVWSLVPDLCDTEYYDQSGEKIIIETVNETVPIDCLTDPPPSPYHDSHDGSNWIWNEDAHKDAVCLLIEQEFLNQLDSPLDFGGNPFQTDKKSQDSITKRCVYAKCSVDDDVNFPWLAQLQTWRDANNIDQPFNTPAEYLAFGKAMTEHVAGHYLAMQTHKDAVRALSTYAEVEAYDYSVNW